MQKTPEQEVREWLRIAKIHATHINMYYSPYNEAFQKLTTRRYVGNVPVGFEFEGYLFTIQAGSGDCEELLVCEGAI
jgi:hypothetical protein